MALKGDRTLLHTEIDGFMNEVAERGGIVVVSTGGSGVAMDQGEQLYTYAADGSGVQPVGLLITEMVNQDLTRQRQNYAKEEVQLGGKVVVAPKCVVTTNRVYPGQNPTAGQLAYVGHSGFVANSDITSDSQYGAATRLVGRWMSSEDENGYAKLSVNLPN
jgi:hypothetical protein